MSAKEWLEIITQIATAGATVVMACIAYLAYLKTPEQDIELASVVDQEGGDKLKEILVFKTSKQQTWLSITPGGLRCRVEDTRKGKGVYEWVISKKTAKTILSSHAYYVNPSYKVRTGTFTLGHRRNWLYSKSLFPEPSYLESMLRGLLQTTIEQ